MYDYSTSSACRANKGTAQRWSLVAWGVSLAALLSADGSMGWRLVRIGVLIAITAAALWLWTRGRRPGAWVAVACGTIGVAVGTVFGLRFLTVDGLSWRAAVGLIELVTGLVLVVAGVRMLVSGLGRGRRFFAGAALVVGVVAVLWALTPAVLATNVPPIPVEEALGADRDRLPGRCIGPTVKTLVKKAVPNEFDACHRKRVFNMFLNSLSPRPGLLP